MGLTTMAEDGGEILREDSYDFAGKGNPNGRCNDGEGIVA